MKKTYVKPELDVIEFDLGEAIAASQCVAQAYNHDRTSCQLLPPFNTIFSDSEQDTNTPPAENSDTINNNPANKKLLFHFMVFIVIYY